MRLITRSTNLKLYLKKDNQMTYRKRRDARRRRILSRVLFALLLVLALALAATCERRRWKLEPIHKAVEINKPIQPKLHLVARSVTPNV